MFDAAVDFDDGLDGGEPRLPRIAAFGTDTGLDAAMALFDGGLADDLGGRGAAKIVDHIGFERWLIALERQDIIGLVGDDVLGDLGPSSWPASASWSRSTGMAVISLVFSGTDSCANVSRAVLA